MFEDRVYPRVTLVTGPRESGRTTYAVMVCAEQYVLGVRCFHNSTALFGWNIEEFADARDGLVALAEQIPERSSILIEEADEQKATRRTGELSRDAAINSALATFANKSCNLILTTIQGNECLIAKPLLEFAYEHVTPFMEARAQESVSLRTLHRLGRYKVPVEPISHNTESILNAMMMADTFNRLRKNSFVK